MKTLKLIASFFVLIPLFIAQPLWADDQPHENKYAVVWETIFQADPKYRQHIQGQASGVLELWKKGVVENVYLNHTENQLKRRKKVNAVFFIQAKDEETANRLLAELPFVKYGVASYSLYPVGVLWLKQFKD